MNPGGLLIRMCHRQQFGFSIEPACECDRRWPNRIARFSKCFGQNRSWVSGEVGNQQIVPPNIEIDLFHYLRHILHQQSANAVGSEILDRRHELSASECGRPGIQSFRNSASSQVVEGTRGFHVKNGNQC